MSSENTPRNLEQDPLNIDFEGFFSFINTLVLYPTTWQAISWVAVIAAVSATIAFFSIFASRSVARKKETLNYIASREADRDVIHAHKRFVKAAKKSGGIAKWAKEKNENEKETRAINLVLNEMELISIGIQFGIIDFKMYRKYNRSKVLRYWRTSAPFIYALRSRLERDSLYSEFEHLYSRMKTEDTQISLGWFRRKP